MSHAAAPSDAGLFESIQRCADVIRQKAPKARADVAIILGSGLGDFADSLQNKTAIPYGELPGFPHSSVPGHAGRLVLGTLGDTHVVAMQGRVHFYEGYAPWQVAFPARVLCALKPNALVLTNAAGGINAKFKVGELMVITDHLNLSGMNPLVGPNDDRLGPRFPDMSHAWDPALANLLVKCGQEQGLALPRGVYAQLSGPAYETPAEIRMLRTLGADAVGMSTVPEVLVASHMGVKVAGVSCITNLAAGLSHEKLSHEEVSQTANQVKGVFTKLLASFLPLAAKAS